ncbi:hypothetical protein [Bacillus sp. CECT 9360]|uniref:hypothetical protein n=1 Tax=Bacillus sp. CECT 9360 TaxID=2845821 RepID=UPI001E4D3465|nr:hypothetical protein [Bacillus sp. CECT 9360]
MATKSGPSNKTKIPATKVPVPATKLDKPATKRKFRQRNLDLATKQKFRQPKSLFRQQNQSNWQQNENFGNEIWT